MKDMMAGGEDGDGGPGGMGGGNPMAQMMGGMMGGGGGPGRGSEQEGGVGSDELKREVKQLRDEVHDIRRTMERIADALDE